MIYRYMVFYFVNVACLNAFCFGAFDVLLRNAPAILLQFLLQLFLRWRASTSWLSKATGLKSRLYVIFLGAKTALAKSGLTLRFPLYGLGDGGSESGRRAPCRFREVLICNQSWILCVEASCRFRLEWDRSNRGCLVISVLKWRRPEF